MPELLLHSNDQVRRIAADEISVSGGASEIRRAIQLLGDARNEGSNYLQRILSRTSRPRLAGVASAILAEFDLSDAALPWAIEQIGTLVDFDEVHEALQRVLDDPSWLIARFAERADVGGGAMSPAIARGLLGVPPEDLLLEGADSLNAEGMMLLLTDGHAQLIASTRTVGEILALEDVFELEHGTALAEFGQRLALRQVVRVAGQFEVLLPRKPPRPSKRSLAVPTHILDEDTYPVGCFTSISTRGSIESLLHSELADMETDKELQPDLFDIKFQRSELLYHSRDENEFLRRRRTFPFILFPGLLDCRVKDARADYQRIILLLGAIVASVRKLIEWLSDDALLFEIVFVRRGGKLLLEEERDLIEMILSEQIANGTVAVLDASLNEITKCADEHARRSLTHVVSFTARPPKLEFDQALHTVCEISAAAPILTRAHRGHSEVIDVESWENAVERLLAELC